MTDEAMHPLEAILRHCAAAEPNPWYPSEHARANGISRDSLDPHLDQLRLGGLIRLTDWVKDLGQGYVLTPAGQELLKNPRLVGKLHQGNLPAPKAPARPFREREGTTSTWDRGEAVREALLSQAPPTVSRLLIWANVLVFLYGLVLANQQGVPLNDYIWPFNKPKDQVENVSAILDQLGSVNGANIVKGQWWRLLTSCFVHIGALHLAMNMYVLYVLGPMSERMWGRSRFLILYLISGLTGSCTALIFSIGGLAGASGALCGLIAAEAAWVFLNRSFLPPPLFSAWTGNLMKNFILIVFISLIPGISWSGHLGGAVGGLVVGALMIYQLFGSLWQRWLAAAAIALVPVTAVGLLLQTMKTDPNWQTLEWFENYSPRVNKMRTNALDIYATRVVPLINQKAATRDPEKVAQALAALAVARDQLAEAIELLKEAGPYNSPALEAERQRYLTGFEKNLAILDEAEKRLREGR